MPWFSHAHRASLARPQPGTRPRRRHRTSLAARNGQRAGEIARDARAEPRRPRSWPRLVDPRVCCSARCRCETRIELPHQRFGELTDQRQPSQRFRENAQWRHTTPSGDRAAVSREPTTLLLRHRCGSQSGTLALAHSRCRTRRRRTIALLGPTSQSSRAHWRPNAGPRSAAASRRRASRRSRAQSASVLPSLPGRSRPVQRCPAHKTTTNSLVSVGGVLRAPENSVSDMSDNRRYDFLPANWLLSCSSRGPGSGEGLYRCRASLRCPQRSRSRPRA